MDLYNLRGRQQRLAMPRMSRLRSWSPRRGRGRGLCHKRWIGSGRTIRVAGGLGQPSFERGDPRGLVLDDGEQLDDQLAHHEQCLCPTGGIRRKPCWQWERSHRSTLSGHTTGGLHCSQAPCERSTHVISAPSPPPTPPPPAGARTSSPWRGTARWPQSARPSPPPAVYA